MQNLKKISFLLSKKERLHAILLLVMTLIMAFIETLGVASILPFVAILSNPQVIETNNILSTVYQTVKNFGIETEQEFFIFLGIFVFILLILSIIFKVLTIYFQIRFSKMCEHNISVRLIKGYLNQSYSWFLNRNSSILSKTILSEVSNVISKGLMPLMSLVTNFFLIIFLCILLIVAEPKLTSIAIIKLVYFMGLHICLILIC